MDRKQYVLTPDEGHYNIMITLNINNQIVINDDVPSNPVWRLDMSPQTVCDLIQNLLEWHKDMIYEMTLERSISDDDLCATCRRCNYKPGDMSSCSIDFPAQFDANGYAVSCDEYVSTETES